MFHVKHFCRTSFYTIILFLRRITYFVWSLIFYLLTTHSCSFIMHAERYLRVSQIYLVLPAVEDKWYLEYTHLQLPD